MVAELTILGTIHKDRKNYTSNDILKILKKVNPNIILYELDSSFFTKDYKFRNINFESQEDVAVSKYLEINPDIKIRPFDIEGRNKFYNEVDYFEKENEVNNELLELYRKKFLSKEANKIMDKMIKYNKKDNEYMSTGPEKINSLLYDRFINKFIYLQLEGVDQIIKTTPQLKKHQKFWRIKKSFWEKRTRVMIDNIIKYVNKYNKFRTIVIVGCKHRSSLRNRLLYIDIESSVNLKEYWEYEN